MSSPSQTFRLCIVAPRLLIKSVKTVLENHKTLDKTSKLHFLCLQPSPEHHHREADLNNYATPPDYTLKEDSCIIPTTDTLQVSVPETAQEALAAYLTTPAGTAANRVLQAFTPPLRFIICLRKPALSQPLETPLPSERTELAEAVHQWLATLPPDLLATLPTPLAPLLLHSLSRHNIYPPLLLLPASTFTSSPWPALLSGPLALHLPSLYASLASALHITHIALNAPIPLHAPTATSPNRLRAPLSLTPLHGAFGPPEPASPAAFARALWVSARQHGVHQRWAPLHSMFSRGNIAEKARLLALPTLRAEALGGPPAESSAVDLYAGIGYFAFFYVKAGVGKVLCWEMNPWSVEGLRRGVLANGSARRRWGVRVVEGAREQVEGAREGEERVVVFQEDNRMAVGRVQEWRGRIPPVRHVNCGYLPTSAPSWPIAVAVLDPERGGWIHAHENMAVADIAARRTEIEDVFTALANPDAAVPSRIVQCQHLERVKSYAPGIMHCVLDIYIGGAQRVARDAEASHTINAT
ncbi:hypothetical protein MMC13_001108 [Lambiella insularis]|nr:hypothetical protein [Lambiella insularis]